MAAGEGVARAAWRSCGCRGGSSDSCLEKLWLQERELREEMKSLEEKKKD